MDPEQRLGNNSAAEVKSHPWFAHINWDDLVARRCRAPFRPRLSNINDMSNFANYDAEISPAPKCKRSNRNLWHLWEWVETDDLTIHTVTANTKKS